MSEGDLVPHRVPTADAERLLARAAALDVQHRAGTVDVAALRQAALAAGIDEAAFEAASREVAASASDPAAPAPPWIVRVTLLGVLNRQAAWGFYVFFMLALFATVVAAVSARVLAPQRAAPYAPTLLFLAVWAVFALWSTAKAIRWADAHGWDRLP